MVSYLIQCYYYLFNLMLGLPQIWPLDAPSSCAFWRSYIILAALPCFLVQQAHLILLLLKPHNQHFLQGALVPFSGEWMVLQVKLWTRCCWDVAASGPFQWAEAADVCTHISIFISVSTNIYQKSWVCTNLFNFNQTLQGSFWLFLYSYLTPFFNRESPGSHYS